MRLIKSRLALALLLALALAPAVAAARPADPAQGLDSIDQCRQLCDSVAKQLSQGRVEEALALLKPHTFLTPLRLAQIAEQFRAQRRDLGGTYGEPTGMEFVETLRVGQSLIKMWYLEKHQYNSLAWNFVFYRPGAKWYLQDFGWNDNPLKLLR